MPLPMPKAPLKPAAKPVAKPSLFEKGRHVPVKELMRGAAKGPVVIPGTGGQRYSKEQFAKILKEKLSHRQVGTHLKEQEAKIILRQMRKEEKGGSSRERRTLEEKWGLKGKY